ncbi:MAG: FAS1-like dehydratase domain-containing protein [Bosea sp. (in: a-proteobacteria)]
MTLLDVDALQPWVGRTREAEDVIGLNQARLMAATIDMDPADIQADQPLRPLWHWIFFLEGFRPTELGRDGHPARGGFLPPVPLANRMWAGGEVQFHGPISIGARVLKKSTISSIKLKPGSSGPLVFVAVTHELIDNGRLLITERHDIVYRNPVPGSSAKKIPELPAAAIERDFLPNATMLFRYSALTFNGHRIHYDVDYCRDVEGYPGLVVHGPLVATLLAGLAQDAANRPIRSFTYRGVRPSIAGAPMTLKAQMQGTQAILWSETATGVVGMTATAVF